MVLGRRRPLLRGAIIGGAAYQIGKNRAKKQTTQDKQANDLQNNQANSQQSSPADETDKKLEKINQLKKLHDSGSLTDEEFAKAKEKIISEL